MQQTPIKNRYDSIEGEDLNIAHQKSFVGGVPADDILEVLDEPEEVINMRLQGINEDNEPDLDALKIDSDDE